jgi:Flp pilus assembly protein TadD
MSLLNDALRKKQSEERSSQPYGAAGLFKAAPGRRFGQRPWVAGIGAAAVLLAAAGIWTLWPWAKGPGASQAAVGLSAEVETSEAPPAAPGNPERPATEPSPALDATARVTPAPAQPLPAQTSPPPPAPDTPQITVAPGLSAAPAAPKVRQRPMQSAPAPQPAELPGRRITSEPLYRKAHLFQRQGRTAEALAMYREVLKIDPNHFDTRLNMTTIYLETGQFTQAHALAADLHRQAPAHAQAMLNLAIAQIGCGRSVEALPLLDQAAALPQAPLYTIYFHKGVALRQLGQPEAAVGWYHKAEALNPGDSRLLFNLALALDQNQAYAEAVNYYTKYLNATKNEPEAPGRGQIQARVHALRAELAATENGDQKP